MPALIDLCCLNWRARIDPAIRERKTMLVLQVLELLEASFIPVSLGNQLSLVSCTLR